MLICRAAEQLRPPAVDCHAASSVKCILGKVELLLPACGFTVGNVRLISIDSAVMSLENAEYSLWISPVFVADVIG